MLFLFSVREGAHFDRQIKPQIRCFFKFFPHEKIKALIYVLVLSKLNTMFLAFKWPV